MTKIVSLKQLSAILSLRKTSAERQRGVDIRYTLSADDIVVLVTGVFDILHQEHKKLLQAAKKQGSLLLVGLESNQRVAQLKGEGRPINTISKRLKNIARLRLADYVFELPKSIATKNGREVLIKKLKPGILAVSSDSPNLAEKRRIMKLVGGKVTVVLPHNPAISTTIIINSLKKGRS